jgi:hypothetical protein
MWVLRGALTAALLAASAAVAAEAPVRQSDFYGTWVLVGERDRSCLIMGESGVETHISLGKDYYARGDAPCQEAKVWLHGKKLRVSATCESDEYGFRATTNEFTLEKKKGLTTISLGAVLLKGKLVRFALCVMPTHHLRLSHVQSIVAADNEISDSAADIVYKGKPERRDADLAHAENKILKKYGYASINQFHGIKYIIKDILQFIDEPDYLSRRHTPGNVELVKAHKDALSKLGEERLEKAQ